MFQLFIYPPSHLYFRISYSYFEMTEVSHPNFRDKTISQLVEELNNLGDDHVAMHPTNLIGIQDSVSESVRRFRSRSMHKSRNSTSREPEKVVQS